VSAAELPLWAAIVMSLLVLIGAGLALAGSIGLLRLRTFYERVHAPTLAGTLGVTCILVASMLHGSLVEGRPVAREIVLGVFLFLSTPIALLLLVRAALYRDHVAGDRSVPAADTGRPDDDPSGSAKRARDASHAAPDQTQ